MNAVKNTTSWVKFGELKNVSIMNKDVICFGTGCHIKFHDLGTQDRKTLTANFPSINGEGVRVVEGHRTTYTFAYADYCENPSIFVKNYPDFYEMSVFRNGPREGYSALSFTETSLLIALSDLPYFSVLVFNWRTSEKYAHMNGDIIMEQQILRCSWGKPNMLAQMGKNSKELYVWDILLCCNKAVIKKRQVKLNNSKGNQPFTDLVWTSEGTLFVVDTSANVYMCDIDFTLTRVISSSTEGNAPTSMVWHKAGLAISCPDLIIRHYKKSDTWICDWVIKLPYCLKSLHCNRTDFMIGVNETEELVKISNIDGISLVHMKQSQFKDFCLIYPTATHVVALVQNTQLSLFSVDDGYWESSYQLSGHANCVTENPEYPYVAVGYDNGRLELVSVFDSKDLSTLVTFNLCSTAFDSVKFFENGRVIVAGNTLLGMFFILEGVAGSKINIIGHVEVGKQIVDYMLVGAGHCHRLFVIPVTSKYLASNQIIRYCVMDQDTITRKQYFAEKKDSLYYRIIPKEGPDRDRVFYALCLTSRNIHVLEIRRGDSTARVISEIKTGHQMKKFDLRLNSRHALTWGFDGFVIARCKEFKTNIGMVLPHHRFYGGVRKAYMDISGKFIISLGRDEILACTDLTDNIIDTFSVRQSIVLMGSSKFLTMFKRPTIGYEAEERFKDTSWLDIQSILKTEKDASTCRIEKLSILEQLQDIRETLTTMVTDNVEGPENEMIDLAEFYLDTATLNQKKARNREKCKETETNTKALIIAQDKVSEFLKKNYLEPMGIPGKIIRGIFQRTVASNYVLLPPCSIRERRLPWIEEVRKVEQYLTYGGSFYPWLALPKADILKHLRSRIVLTAQDYGGIARRIMTEASMSQRPIETQIALIGTVSQLYIERNPAHYRQREVVTFQQADMQQAITEAEITKLKMVYNVNFEQMMEEKYREMESIKKKHDRMRHIIYEYNYFSTDKVFIDIEDPTWTQDEQPWLLEKVENDELTTTPYISPSEQAILDAKAAEEERIRLALLADDFRERGLMAMMNGVLEIKWEDELKKDIPLPKCMLEKDPAQFNEEDLRAIKEYEGKVAFLNSERERYKNLLDVEYSKLAVNLRDSIKKFNERLQSSVEYKTCIDSAMNEENLIINRFRLIQYKKLKLLDEQKEIQKQIAEGEEQILLLNETHKELNDIQAECKTQSELFATKDKVLEKQFRKEFFDSSILVQEQAFKLYKKRPRATFRNINASAVLFELAKCVTSGEKSKILTSDCLDYLKSLEQLDHFIGLPPTIDEHIFQVICKHRRQRIEYEIKVRANQIQLQDGESAIATFHKRAVHKKEKVFALQNELERLRQEYLILLHNLQIQIVLRKGLVEVPLTGDVNDFEDAILVPRSEIEQINDLIKQTGSKKISTIIKNMSFRRNIMATEWEHQRMRMQINDCIEHIRDIEAVKFTRDMQQYLKCKSSDRKYVDSYEQQIEVLLACYENTIRDKKEKHRRVTHQAKGYKEHNALLDKAIQEINLDVCHLRLQEDLELQKNNESIDKERLRTLLKRNTLVRQIQQNHNEILVLQTELELLRLKTYPTFKYKLLDPTD